MITVNDFFQKVLYIGSVNRPDRAAQMRHQFAKFGIQAERFEAHWKPVVSGTPNGNAGCTASHRGVLELIAHHGWERTLVLEDDAQFLSDDFNEQFDAVAQEAGSVPWDFLFLGASYAEAPKRRVTGSLIQTNGLMTTSSYGITRDMARKMAPHISGIGPIDSLFQQWQRSHTCLICSPRLIVQRPGFSDLQDKQSENVTSMIDTYHEEMLLEGEWVVGFGDYVFHGPLMRRELSEAAQMVGELVIIDGKRFTVTRVELPDHRMPWFAGEPVTYFLKPETP